MHVSTVPIFDEKLVIHKHSLFETMIPYNNDVSLSSGFSTTLLNNLPYNLKLVRSIVSVLERQFVMKGGMANNLSELLDLNLRVSVMIMCFFRV